MTKRSKSKRTAAADVPDAEHRAGEEEAPATAEKARPGDAGDATGDDQERDRANGSAGGRETEDLERLESELEEARAEKLRLLAEFRNFRQRMERDRARIRNDAAAGFFGGLLPIVHDLERAREAATKDGVDASIAEGIDLVLRRFRDFMQREGLVEVDPIGESFDENTMEAMGMIPSDEHAEGCVAQVFQKGLLLGERLIEPARVLVSTGPPPAADDAK